jgi:hypothetical protein
MPMMPLEYQADTQHSGRMKNFFLLLVTTSAFADWTIRYRSGEQLLEQGKSDEAIQELQSGP